MSDPIDHLRALLGAEHPDVAAILDYVDAHLRALGVCLLCRGTGLTVHRDDRGIPCVRHCQACQPDTAGCPVCGCAEDVPRDARRVILRRRDVDPDSHLSLLGTPVACPNCAAYAEAIGGAPDPVPGVALPPGVTPDPLIDWLHTGIDWGEGHGPAVTPKAHVYHLAPGGEFQAAEPVAVSPDPPSITLVVEGVTLDDLSPWPRVRRRK